MKCSLMTKTFSFLFNYWLKPPSTYIFPYFEWKPPKVEAYGFMQIDFQCLNCMNNMTAMHSLPNSQMFYLFQIFCIFPIFLHTLIFRKSAVLELKNPYHPFALQGHTADCKIENLRNDGYKNLELFQVHYENERNIYVFFHFAMHMKSQPNLCVRRQWDSQFSICFASDKKYSDFLSVYKQGCVVHLRNSRSFPQSHDPQLQRFPSKISNYSKLFLQAITTYNRWISWFYSLQSLHPWS